MEVLSLEDPTPLSQHLDSPRLSECSAGEHLVRMSWSYKEEKEIDHGVTESLLVDGCVQLCVTFSQSIASSGVKEMSLESTLSSEPLLMK